MAKGMDCAGTKIIIVTGPESTGKTTVAEALSARFDGTLVPEFARTYISALSGKYAFTDIQYIARKQHEAFQQACFSVPPQICFFDTYLIITKIWMQWHASRYDKWIDQAIAQTQDALYLLCAPDIEWQADPLRENGGEARLRLFDLYRSELEKFRLRYEIVTGFGDQRISNASGFVKSYIDATQVTSHETKFKSHE